MGNLLTPDELAEKVRMSTSLLAQRRFLGLPPVFLKPSKKTVLYREEDVDAWLNASVQSITGEAA